MCNKTKFFEKENKEMVSFKFGTLKWWLLYFATPNEFRPIYKNKDSLRFQNSCYQMQSCEVCEIHTVRPGHHFCTKFCYFFSTEKCRKSLKLRAEFSNAEKRYKHTKCTSFETLRVSTFLLCGETVKNPFFEYETLSNICISGLHL